MLLAHLPIRSAVHPHDHFFRTVMSDVRVARDFLLAHLPVEMLQSIDLSHLILQPRSFIDGVRKESIIDLLYKTVLAGEEAYIYLLLEHQSTPDELMPLRILKYTCQVLDQHLKNADNKKLPLVYPIVIYHGERSYSYSTDINDLVNAPRELVDRYFLKPFQLVDLSKIEDNELKRHQWASVMEFALKRCFARDIMPYLQDFVEILRRIDQSGGEDYISIVLQYLLKRAQLENNEAFFELISKQISLETGEKIMTIAEQLRAEGRIRASLEIAKSLLREGLEPDFVTKVTGITLEQINNNNKDERG